MKGGKILDWRETELDFFLIGKFCLSEIQHEQGPDIGTFTIYREVSQLYASL